MPKDMETIRLFVAMFRARSKNVFSTRLQNLLFSRSTDYLTKIPLKSVFCVNHAAHTRHFYAHNATLNTSNNKNKLHSGNSTGQGYNVAWSLTPCGNRQNYCLVDKVSNVSDTVRMRHSGRTD